MEMKLPESLLQFLDLKRGVCLTGKTGIGKTMALSLFVREWLLSLRQFDFAKGKRIQGKDYLSSGYMYYPWKFISFPEFIMEVQDSFKSNSEETALEMLNEIATTRYLIIDDLGAEKPTDYVRQATYYVINHREMHELPTFITTNFSMSHLDENIDPRISSRIAGMCEILRFEGKDRRIKNNT